MKKNIIKVLNHFSLDENEIETYLAALQLGQATAYEIAKLSGLKRPTVYVLIEELKRKGLMTTFKEKGKTICSPLPPKRLIEIWKGRMENLMAISPQLDVFYKKNKFQPKISIFEGEKGVEAVYQELLPKGKNSEEVLVFGSISPLKESFSHQLDVWRQVIKNPKNKIRELINLENDSLEYAREMKKFGSSNYQIRMAGGNIFGLNDNIIYKNKIAIFSLYKELFVITIESEEIAKTYRALFEAAWANAKKI